MSKRFAVHKAVLSFLLVVAGIAHAESDELVLVDVQGVRAVVVTSAQAQPDESLAAQEFVDHIAKIAGKTIPLVKANPEDVAAEVKKAADRRQVAIVIGEAAMDDALRASIRAKSTDPAAFAIRVDSQAVCIAGLSPEGTLFGVYSLLEQFGCRWFMPGEFGAVIPKTTSLAIRSQHTVEAPSFAGRTLQMLEGQKDWYRKMRLGGKPVPGAHGINIGKPKIEEHPELFAVVNGKRSPHQYCISNPEVLRLAIEHTRRFFHDNPDADMIGMGPGDGREFCECERCRALDAGDWDPYAKMVSITDRYVWFFNSVLEAIDPEFPNKSIAFYAYDGTMRPPVKVKPNPRIIPVFALIRVCHLHGMSNPVCPERGYYQTLLTQWSGLVSQCFDRDYLLNYSGYPIGHVHRSREEIPLLHKSKVTRVRRQTYPYWGNMTPGIYVTAKLLWDVNADVDAIKQDFYDKFFGPAAVPMARYLDRIDAAYHSVDHHPRWENVNIAQVLPPEAVKLGKSDLEHAASLATGEMYAKRVAAFRLMHDAMETYLAALEAQDHLDFAAASEKVNMLVRLQEQALQHDPPLLHELTALSLQKSIEDAYARTTGDCRMLAGASATWDFLIDPPGIGEELQFWRNDLRGGNWGKRALSSIALKAIVGDWDQELRWYSGDAWYRNSVQLPNIKAGSRVFLWFRRLPDGSKVWINGQLVGQCLEEAGMRKPYEIDVTDAIKADRENQIAIRATGPMHGPVMFYSTTSASDKQVRTQEH